MKLTSKFNDFVEAAKNFRNDTKEWYGLDQFKFYSTKNSTEWYESADNANGGLALEWAFGLSDEKIDELAKGEFLRQLTNRFEAALDEGLDIAQWEGEVSEFFE